MDKQGRTALSYAAYMGYLKQVQILLTAVPHSAFISNKDKSFPIHQAVLGGHISVINLLLTSSRFLLNAIGQNILHVSVLAGDLTSVTNILNSIEVESLINQKDEDGNTPLQLVKKLTLVNDRDKSLVLRLRFLLERAAKGLKSIPIDDYLYQLLLHGDLNQVCQIILDRRLELNDLICLEDGCNILHVAVSMDQPLLVVDLLRRNCDTLLYLANYKGDLPYHSAAKACNLQSLKALLEWPNISVDACRTLNDKGNTALHIAVFNNHPEMAKYLYNKCPQAAYCLNKDKICPLFLAIKTWGESDLVDNMIDGLEGNTQIQTDLKDAKSIVHMTMFTRTKAILKNIIVKAPRLMDSFDSKGRNPLSYAAHIGYVEGVKLLLDRHPHLEFKRDMDNDGSFPIHQAVKGGQVKIIKLLHPKICLLNSNRQSVLHVAADSGNTNVVRFLLKLQKFKELLNNSDDNGNTPLHLAVKGAHYKIVCQLTQEKHAIGNSTNKELLTPRDLFENYVQDPCQKVPSEKQINLMDLMLKRVQGEKSLLSERIDDQGNSQKQTKTKQTESTKYNTSLSLDGKLKLTNKERANTFLVVATLIITVSFTAAFTPPGDYKGDTGVPTLIRSPAFKLFIVCNGFAFLFAVISALALIIGMIVEKLTDITLFLGGLYISVGILCMLLAFLAGSVDVQILSLMKPKDSRWKWKGWKLFDLETKEFFGSRDVKFVDDMFPFVSPDYANINANFSDIGEDIHVDFANFDLGYDDNGAHGSEGANNSVERGETVSSATTPRHNAADRRGAGDPPVPARDFS
uniref:PGG domain-containing protein n=1 Tax=Chenopodium quinoa TaxID=63459 RepID=A0A803M6G3_CHEQI